MIMGAAASAARPSRREIKGTEGPVTYEPSLVMVLAILSNMIVKGLWCHEGFIAIAL